MARVSLCMIVRNEEKNLPVCLESIGSLFDEIIVVDTGSTDRTTSIARSFDAKVVDFPWCDNFSAARNEALRHATGDWIFWLDADDRLDAAQRAKLAALFAELDDRPRFYMLHCISDSKSSYQEPVLLLQPRLFRNHPQARWRYRVHEQLAPSLTELGFEQVLTDIVIRHCGYLDDALVQRKINRDLRLLRLDYLAFPDDPAVLYHLAQTHLQIGQYEPALTHLLHLRRGTIHPSEWGAIVLSLLGKVLSKMGRLDDARQCVQEGLSYYPDDADLLFQAAEHNFLSERWGDSERDILKLLNSPPSISAIRRHDPTHAVQSGLRLLGVLYARSGHYPQAESAYRTLVERFPDFGHGWLCLADLYMAFNHDRLEDTLQNLERCADGPALAKVLRAKVLMQNGDFAPAKALLDDAIAALPTMVWPLWVLGQWHEMHGDPLETRIAICQNILRRCPEHHEARAALNALQNELRALQATPTSGAHPLYFGLTVG